MSPRSGKPSASSIDSPPDPPALFIDRCAWSVALGRALTEAGIAFVAHHDQFEHNAPDETWLCAAADKGWLVVTRDQRIRYRANELAAMRRARLHVFVFTQGGLTGAETGSILVHCHAEMVRAARDVEPPAFFSLTRRGDVNRLTTGS